jgi:peptidoglycan/xylan/chitin deacetylase (PgdA/CDA1 family)
VAASERVMRRLSGVTVFMYHGIGSAPGVDHGDPRYWISGDLFRQHLAGIHDAGHRIALLGEVWSGVWPNGRGRPPIVLTFDDGRASDYEVAYPLLLEAEARAEFFLNTHTIGRPGYLTWTQVAEMQRQGMSFQSHGDRHVVLLGLPRPALDRELRRPKLVLEDRLGGPVDFLAAPYGLFDRRVVSVARTVGYRAVCTSRCWPARPGASTVNRVAVYPDTTSTRFAAFLDQSPLHHLPDLVRTALLHLPKRAALKLCPGLLGVGRAAEGA